MDDQQELVARLTEQLHAAHETILRMRNAQDIQGINVNEELERLQSTNRRLSERVLQLSKRQGSESMRTSTAESTSEVIDAVQPIVDHDSLVQLNREFQKERVALYEKATMLLEYIRSMSYLHWKRKRKVKRLKHQKKKLLRFVLVNRPQMYAMVKKYHAAKKQIQDQDNLIKKLKKHLKSSVRSEAAMETEDQLALLSKKSNTTTAAVETDSLVQVDQRTAAVNANSTLIDTSVQVEKESADIGIEAGAASHTNDTGVDTDDLNQNTSSCEVDLTKPPARSDVLAIVDTEDLEEQYKQQLIAEMEETYQRQLAQLKESCQKDASMDLEKWKEQWKTEMASHVAARMTVIDREREQLEADQKSLEVSRAALIEEQQNWQKNHRDPLLELLKSMVLVFHRGRSTLKATIVYWRHYSSREEARRSRLALELARSEEQRLGLIEASQRLQLIDGMRLRDNAAFSELMQVSSDLRRRCEASFRRIRQLLAASRHAKPMVDMARYCQRSRELVEQSMELSNRTAAINGSMMTSSRHAMVRSVCDGSSCACAEQLKEAVAICNRQKREMASMDEELIAAYDLIRARFKEDQMMQQSSKKMTSKKEMMQCLQEELDILQRLKDKHAQ